VNDDYLWDRSGPPDPEVEKLEKLLGRYKHDAPLRVAAHRRRWAWVAVAATLLLLVGGGYLFRLHWPDGRPWEIETFDGTPTVNGEPVEGHDRLGIGDTLVTDAQSRVTVRIARVGELEIQPGTELRLVATSRGRHRIALRRGTINARVWAPPFTFGVQTPAGLASDIGCAFSLRYANQGGLLRVTSGWVDFDGDNRSSLVPEGAMAELRRELGPGTPYWHDAPQTLREALRAFDRTGSTHDLQRVLDAARPRDGMTLQHLLERARAEHRPVLYDKLSAIAPPPAGVTREGILQRDQRMLSRWRESMGLGGVKKWWVHWRDALPES
jgi:hypothetical protein